MIAEIVEKPEMIVVGLLLNTSFRDERNKREIPPFFHKVLEEKKLEIIPDRLNSNQLCIFKMQKDNPDFEYIMGVEVSNRELTIDGYKNEILNTGTYVRVKTVKRGPEDVGRAFSYILNEWMPQSEYIPSGAPAFIYYDNEFFDVFNKLGYAGNPMATLYISIKKRN